MYDAALDAFEQIRTLLASVNIPFDQVIRTWLYLGGIVADEGPAQRYKELNRARTDFFEDIHFLADRLPPGRRAPCTRSAGLSGQHGHRHRGPRVMMSAIALATDRKDIIAVPLENPRQTSAFDYGDTTARRPRNSRRAMALSCGNYATIFVSGTASITNSETRHVGDAVAQTHETLDNIAALISEENLCRHGLPGLGTSLEGMGLVRVYIKRAGGLRRGPRGVREAPGRAADDLRHGRRLPPGPAGGDRRHCLLPQGGGAAPRNPRAALSALRSRAHGHVEVGPCLPSAILGRPGGYDDL